MAEVLPVQLPDGQSYFSPSPLRRSSPSQPSFLVAPSGTYSPSRHPRYPPAELNEYGTTTTSLPASTSSPLLHSSEPPQPTPIRRYYQPHNTSRLVHDSSSDDDDDDGLSFPSYNDSSSYTDTSSYDDDDKTEASVTMHSSGSDSAVSTNSCSTPEPLPVAEDDTAIKPEPSRHVDYLSHDWKEEDIWSSWRHITTNRKTYGQRSRLENASWRTWAKSKYRLRTVSPETLNWLKDCDVTWLYGPLQTSNSSFANHVSEASSHISKNNSFINKKPILKKRSMSEVMLQRSISSSSLLKQAAAAVQAQQEDSTPTVQLQTRPHYPRAASSIMSIPSKSTSREATDYFTSRSTSGISTPGTGEKKHIRFDEKVEQCIAIDNKDDNDYENTWALNDDSDSDSDDCLEIKAKPSRRISRSSSKNNSGPENKTIAKLPDTTLKYRTESPDVTDQTPAHSLGLWRSSALSPSSSQETLRPSRPSSNFLLGEDDDSDDEADMNWEPSFAGRRDSVAVTRAHQLSDHNDGSGSAADSEAAGASSGGLRRTPSGMFMPYEEDEDDIVAAGLFGKVVDTVNTAKDIAHVIWNVGWRS
ncbi:uncharacterized protein K452DRAFT_219146 [Aplosporella prunicola CBS 121167]|uniref:Nitrogen regulatory protein areA GATA-like domain-containing protein n=1 Tax=Aplosporella prunicola CBS 121167 TaxID=1176127 RepID=A0A6A6BRT8_9PEZI|nr:uncharacterized protein K452DRAFT_219146 [Aplosporella prunicola CBS 121167]KAF2146498.1 hypothetical protein K452DRAFT_219146 [Aplosporella prunicola CBS 121167]